MQHTQDRGKTGRQKPSQKVPESMCLTSMLHLVKGVAESGVLLFIYSSPFEIISKYVGSKVVGKSHTEEVLLEG